MSFCFICADHQGTDNVVPALNTRVKNLAQDLGIKDNEELSLAQLQKRLSEVSQNIGNIIEQRPEVVQGLVDKLDTIRGSLVHGSPFEYP
jgi:hypothetical protein